jgi:hypothetical protein
MPNFDKTGPEGKGKMTGRGMGPCNPDARQFPGRGRGRGRGRGFGRRAVNPEKGK